MMHISQWKKIALGPNISDSELCFICYSLEKTLNQCYTLIFTTC